MKKISILILVIFIMFIVSSCNEYNKEMTNTFQTNEETILPTQLSQSTVLSPAISASVITSDTSPELIELIDEASLPTPQGNDWFEWDTAGTYYANYVGSGYIFYNEEKDLIICTKWDASDLIISHIDGSDKQVLDIEVYGRVNYLDGWIYYTKLDGVWKVKPDGTEKHQIIVKSTDFFTDQFFVYDNRVYFMRDYEESILSTDLEGEEEKIIDVPGFTMGFYYFENGYLYYGAIIDEDKEVYAIYKYDLSTGEAKEIVACEPTSPIIVQNGLLYYINSGILERTDGNISKSIVNDNERIWDSNYNLYSNYLLYFKNDYKFGSLDSGMLYALNVDTGIEYELFCVNKEYPTQFYIMENSVFLFSGFSNDIIYKITFEDDQAKLWRLNGMDY